MDGTARRDDGSGAARADVLAFAAPLHVRVPAERPEDLAAIACVDDALAALSAAGPLRFGTDGQERIEWSVALEEAAAAKFERTPAAAEAARRAFRAYAASIGILVTVRRD
jgi:hypothetical protein